MLKIVQYAFYFSRNYNIKSQLGPSARRAVGKVLFKGGILALKVLRNRIRVLEVPKFVSRSALR